MGYHGTVTPPVILRNVLENPGWYTAYTPYQAEIAQGRLEALLNFQTMICDLTGMQIANASLLDEATAAAEAMAMAHALSKTKSNVLAVATDLHPQTLAVLATRASRSASRWPMSHRAIAAIGAAKPFALVLQYPGTTGALRDLSEEIAAAHEAGALAIVAADLLALALLTPPGRDGRRYRRRLGAALRRADGLRRPACRLLRHARRVQARHAGPPGRRVAGCRRRSRPCAWRCKPASSTSAAKKRRPTSAPRRCCWRSSPASTPPGTGRRGCAASPGAFAAGADARRRGDARRAALRHDSFFDTIVVETARAAALIARGARRRLQFPPCR